MMPICPCCHEQRIEVSAMIGHDLHHLCRRCFMQLSACEVAIAPQERRWMEAAYIGRSARVSR